MDITAMGVSLTSTHQWVRSQTTSTMMMTTVVLHTLRCLLRPLLIGVIHLHQPRSFSRVTDIPILTLMPKVTKTSTCMQMTPMGRIAVLHQLPRIMVLEGVDLHMTMGMVTSRTIHNTCKRQDNSTTLIHNIMGNTNISRRTRLNDVVQGVTDMITVQDRLMRCSFLYPS